MRRTLLAAIGLALASGAASAQTEVRPPMKAGWRRAGGFHFGYPNVVSVAMGAQRTVFRRDNPPIDVRHATFFIVGEPGLGASRASAGWMYTGYNAGGVAFRLSVFQQYYQEYGTAVGPEISFMKFLFLGGRLGFFRRIAGTSQRVLAGFDFSFMY